MAQEHKFIPKEGQVDYTNIRWCPVVNCVVRYKDTFLLVQRSEGLRLYPGYWNGVSGFLDDNKNLEEKVEEELREELGIGKEKIVSITLGEVFDQNAEEYKKTWIVHPVLVVVTTDQVVLDFEAQKHVLVSWDELKTYDLMPSFDLVLEKISRLMK